MKKNRLCEIFEQPSPEEGRNWDASVENNFFCYVDCSRYAHWRGKLGVGIDMLVLAFILAPIA